MKLDLQSERYAATGNISGSGIRRSLGAPTLDRLQILIRESGQNAWDARQQDGVPVAFGVHIRLLTPSQRKALRALLSDLPPTGESRNQIEASMGADSLSVLEVGDHGTTGLGGPVRADREHAEDERPDFVNFFRNVGSTRDRDFGAGTYGYGKSSLFRLSRCGTIIAYTRTLTGGRNTSRLMAASIGEAFTCRRQRFTGRHWWGRSDRDDVVDPVTGAQADAIARSLGMEPRGGDALGTSIVVLDPDLEDRSPVQAGNAVAECLVWFFWPKLLPDAAGVPAMQFSVRVQEQDISVPDVKNMPPLDIFADAMAQAKSLQAQPISCERPKQLLGQLGLAKGPRRPRRVLDVGGDRGALVPPQSACIALMRPAELVVKYLSTPKMASDMIEYGGVFICDDDVEQVFADAEPPAHDDWVPDYLEGRNKTYVRVALRRIYEAAEHYANPAPSDVALPEQRSLATVGDALGEVLLGQLGTRLGMAAEPAGPGVVVRPSRSSRREVILSDPEAFRFAMVRRIPCAVFRLHIEVRNRQDVTLEAQPLVVLEGGVMEPADNHDGLEIAGWLSATGELVSDGPNLKLRGPVDENLFVAISVKGDTAISVQVGVRSEHN